MRRIGPAALGLFSCGGFVRVALLPGATVIPAEAKNSSLPVITRARAELSEERLFVEGKNFGSSPRVLLGAPAGGFDELVVLPSAPPFSSRRSRMPPAMAINGRAPNGAPSNDSKPAFSILQCARA
jgi:hypothetical protein